MPTLLEAMQSRVGIQEIPGAQHNPAIVKWFADVGHPEIKDDETANCSACVGSAAIEAGLPTPPHNTVLMARSWLTWGVKVEPGDVKPGDVAIWPRGDPKGWQGHVNVIEIVFPGGLISCIGANQGDAVTRAKPRPVVGALGFRRAVPATVADLRKAGSSEIRKADQIQNAGWFSLLVTAVMGVIQELTSSITVPTFTSLPEQLTWWQTVLSGVSAIGGLVVAHPYLAGGAVLAIVAWVVGRRLKTARVAKHAVGIPISAQVAGA